MNKFAIATLALTVLAALAGPPGPPARAAGSIQVAAHRGGGLLWPENSLLAFDNAVKLGAHALEFDVHLSSDGEVVVIHDPTLHRTTTGTGPVRARTVAELRSLLLKERNGPTAERVPLLDEVVRLAAAGQRDMFLEIKVDERGQRYPGVEEKVLAILDRHAMGGKTVVMAFEVESWKRVRELRPTQRVGALYSGRTLAAMGSTAAREVEAAHRDGAAYVGLQYGLIAPEIVALAARLGIALGAWTVNDAAAIDRIIGLGVTLVTSDRPDLVLKAAAGR